MTEGRVSSARCSSPARQPTQIRATSAKQSKQKAKKESSSRSNVKGAVRENKTTSSNRGSGDLKSGPPLQSGSREYEQAAAPPPLTNDYAWEVDLGDFKKKTAKQRKGNSKTHRSQPSESPRATPRGTPGSGEMSNVATQSYIKQRKVFNLTRW